MVFSYNMLQTELPFDSLEVEDLKLVIVFIKLFDKKLKDMDMPVVRGIVENCPKVTRF